MFNHTSINKQLTILKPEKKILRTLKHITTLILTFKRKSF